MAQEAITVCYQHNIFVQYWVEESHIASYGKLMKKPLDFISKASV